MSLAQVVAVIPAAELARRKADQKLLHGARQRAGQLVQAAEQEAALLRQRGYEAGLAEGRRQALARQTEMAQQLALLRDAAKDQMVDVFSQGLRHVMAGPAREEFFSGFLEEAQQLLGRMRFARLLVHPSDEVLVRSLAQRSSLGRSDSPVSIERDPDLDQGACALVSDVGKVSVSLQSRLEDVEAVLNQVFATVDITVGEPGGDLLAAPPRWDTDPGGVSVTPARAGGGAAPMDA